MDKTNPLVAGVATVTRALRAIVAVAVAAVGKVRSSQCVDCLRVLRGRDLRTRCPCGRLRLALIGVLAEVTQIAKANRPRRLLLRRNLTLLGRLQPHRLCPSRRRPAPAARPGRASDGQG